VAEDDIELNKLDTLDFIPDAVVAEQTFRDLAVNIMRVARSHRGGGEAWALTRQVIDCAKALVKHSEINGALPSANDMARALWIFGDGPKEYPGLSPETAARERAEDRAMNEIMSGALRIAAARLSGNRNQEDQGRLQVVMAIREWKGDDR